MKLNPSAPLPLRARRTLSACLAVAAFVAVPAGANEATEWNVLMWQVAGASKMQATSVMGRNLSLMHLAMHDAVNAIERRYEAYGFDGSLPGANAEAAVAAAGHRVAARIFSDQAEVLQKAFTTRIAKIPEGAERDAGVALGEQAAAKILALRADDRMVIVPGGEPFESGKGPYGSGPGAWYPSPDSPHQNANYQNARSVMPLTMASPGQFRNVLHGPPKLTSAHYAADLEEVRKFGGKEGSERTGSKPPSGSSGRILRCTAYSTRSRGHSSQSAATIFGSVRAPSRS
jgi:hypothetical protein